MSQSPTQEMASDTRRESYLEAFGRLSEKIRDGDSFSGRERNCLFLNTGAGRFADVSALSGFDLSADSRAMALADWDRDGDLDVWLTNRTAPRLQFLRNDIPADVRWIALKLEGDPSRNCPRDAVGARVEVVTESDRRIVRTLHAGDAFLSQSTSWMVIGLGGASAVGGIDVRWPGGEMERFAAAETNRRYLLRQGAGTAEPIATQPLTVAPAALPLPDPTDTARIRLSQPLLIRDWNYRTADGSPRTLGERPVLINLWASWCAPCADELAEWGASAQRFADAGLDVVALNMESLGTDAARAFLRKAGYAMDWGYPSDSLVGSINTLIRQAVYDHDDLPAPSSLLVDRGGWLSVIYKGSVTADRILADFATIDDGPETARRESLPYPGRWAADGFEKNPVAIARAYMAGGYTEDARRQLADFLDRNGPDPTPDKTLNQQLGDVTFHLGLVASMEGNAALAAKHYRNSLRFNAYAVPTLNNLAWLLATSADTSVRNGAGAVRHAEFMMQAPGTSANPDLLATLAAAYAEAGRFDDAVVTTKRILALLESAGETGATSARHRTQQERLRQFEAKRAL